MGMKIVVVAARVCLPLFLIYTTNAQDDSLRNSINAIERRQEEYNPEYGYDNLERAEELSFLKPAADYPTYSNLADYVDEPEPDEAAVEAKKRISSSFRERVEEDKQKQMEELARYYLLKLENDQVYPGISSDQYEELVRELWQKYRHQYEPRTVYSNSERAKRYFYPQFGLAENVGLKKKRNRHYSKEGNSDMTIQPYSHMHYMPRESLPVENYDDYIPVNHFKDSKLMKYFQQTDSPAYFNRNLQFKRFPVSKRSSEYPGENKQRPVLPIDINKETDPKVERELSNIFGVRMNMAKQTTSKAMDLATSTHKPITTQKSTNNKNDYANTKQKNKPINKAKAEKVDKINNTKEVAMYPYVEEKPLQIEKKSIDWSDYFGLDRKKKSEPNLNNEWLVEKYRNSVALATKRNKDSLLQTNSETELVEHKDEQKIEDMDGKLKDMEDQIVDDALKFTGAHEGINDPKEVQDVKDKVINRLAAAYSLEKMRNALGEYKLAVNKERERLKHQRKMDKGNFQEEKRSSVPRKQAIDEKQMIDESGNMIKCVQGGSGDCMDVSTPTDLLEQYFGHDTCRVMENNCEAVSAVLEHVAPKFERACTMYEMCLICTNNYGLAPTRHCNNLFLSKAHQACTSEDESCLSEAKLALRVLFDIHRTVQLDPEAQEECEGHCPNMESLSELFQLR